MEEINIDDEKAEKIDLLSSAETLVKFNDVVGDDKKTYLIRVS